MHLPTELFDEPDDTVIIGDLDAFMAYLESGQAWHDWHEMCATANQEIDRYIRAHAHTWRQSSSAAHRHHA